MVISRKPSRPAASAARRPTATPADRLSADARGILADRLERRIAELGSEKKQVAKAASITEALLHKLLGGAVDNPKYSTISALSRVLNVSVAWLFGAPDHIGLDAATIPLMGQAEVGTFRSEKPQQSGTIGDIRPLDKRFVDSERRAVIVADGGLEEVVHAPGAVRVIGYYIVAGPDMTIEDGEIYLIHRLNSDGQFETAFRRAAVFPDRFEFTTLFRDARKNERYRLVVPREPAAAPSRKRIAKGQPNAETLAAIEAERRGELVTVTDGRLIDRLNDDSPIEIAGLFYTAIAQYR